MFAGFKGFRVLGITIGFYTDFIDCFVKVLSRFQGLDYEVLCVREP